MFGRIWHAGDGRAGRQLLVVELGVPSSCNLYIVISLSLRRILKPQPLSLSLSLSVRHHRPHPISPLIYDVDIAAFTSPPRDPDDVMPSAAPAEIRRLAEVLLSIVLEVACIRRGDSAVADGPLRDDCIRLARKVSLLTHLLEEVRDFAVRAGDGNASASSSSAVSPSSCLADLMLALEATKRFLLLGCRPPAGNPATDLVSKKIAVQFQYVSWQLEKSLGNLPYEYFEISDEVQEEMELVRAQLRRVIEKTGAPNLNLFQEIYNILSRAQKKEVKQQLSRAGGLQIEKTSNPDRDFQEIVILVAEVNGKSKGDAEKIMASLMERPRKIGFTDPSAAAGADIKSCNSISKMTLEAIKKTDSLVIPEDFRCPISLELMRDPVIVSTGQTYERSFIQRWIDCGNRTCPKTQQKLQNLTLTPNYVLKSLIIQWCETNRIEQPLRSMSGLIRKSDGSFHGVTGDRAAISVLVHNLSSSSLEEQRSAAAEIRSLAKRSTDNRILIAEAGAIPFLVNLLSVEDQKTQEHAVTSLLNLSIYGNNKEAIMLAGAIVPIIEVLRKGSMEARENAAASIFSLSLNDENKITIGCTPGAIESLVELLQSGSARGKKDAATALFNLCVYQGNKARAVHVGILTPLVKMLQDSSSSGMVDQALTILLGLVSQEEGKLAIVKAKTIPVLIDLLRTGQPRNKENAAAILLALCKKDADNLACIGRLGALIPLSELARSGTDRAKRKANSLLDNLSKLQMF